MRFFLLTVFILFGSIAHAFGAPSWHPLAGTDASGEAARFVAASQPDGISVDLSIPGFDTETIRVDDADCQILTLRGWQTNSETGAPLIPQLVKCIAIPKSCQLEEITVDVLSSDTLTSSVRLAPVPTLINGKLEFRRDSDAFSRNAWVPGKPCFVERTGFIREQKTAWIRINPVQYNPVTNKILIHKNLRLKIRFNNQESVNFGPFEALGRELFLNADKSGDPAPAPRNQGSVTYPTDLLNAQVTADYILITTEGLIHTPVLDSLADYRASFSGLDVAVVSTSDIVSQFPAADPSRSIRNFLIRAYGRWTSRTSGDGRPIYVLLVGEGNPSSPNSISGYDSKPADYPYACVNDDNGDGAVDDIDLVCDLMLGRFSVDDESELESIFRKMRGYESTLSEQEPWRRKICLVNGFADSLWAGNVKKSYDDFSEEVAGQEFFTIAETLSKPELGTEGLRSSFIDALNDGRGICNVNIHGSADGWSNSNGQILFLAGDMPLLHNGARLPVVLSFACLTGNFMNEGGDCLGEALVNAPDGGAVAFFGSGFLEGLHESLFFNSRFFDVLMHIQGLSLGAVLSISQGSLSTGYSLLGDPALSFTPPVTRVSLLPDLHVKQVKFRESSDYPPYISGLQAIIENLGILKADNVKVQFYNGDPLAGGSPLGPPKTISIPPFGGKGQVEYYFKNLKAGPITPYVWADPDNVIEELREDNNIASDSTQWMLPELCYDWSGITVFWGVDAEDPVRITTFINNRSIVRAENVIVGFYDGNPDSGGVCIGRDTLAAEEQSQSCQASVTLDHYQKNDITVYVRIDPDNAIRETDETNNTAFIHESKDPIYRVDYGLWNVDNLSNSTYTNGDFNNDGLMDFFLIDFMRSLTSLYLNKGNFKFDEIPFMSSTGHVWLPIHPPVNFDPVDFDNDGLLDVFVSMWSIENGSQTFIALNIGDGQFEEIPHTGLWPDPLNFYDYDNDGLPDLMTVRPYLSGQHPAFDIGFLKNMGNGEFVAGPTSSYVDSSTTYKGGMTPNVSYSTLADFNDDANPDLILIPDFGPHIILMKGGGDGTFSDATAEAGIDELGMGSPPVYCLDFDYDGDMDILFSSGTVCLNNGGRFERMNLNMMVVQGNFLDIENDGLLECIGQVCTGSGCNVGSYEITPSGKLEKDDTMIKSKITSIIGYDITDYDGNGFMEPFGYINAGNSNHWIRIRLRGRQSNAFGLGARIKVYNGSHVQTLDVINASIFNFGLAQNTTVDSVVVRWPSRVVDRLCNVSADRLLTVEEGIGDSSIPTEFYFSQNYPNPFNAQTSIRYVIPGEGHSPGKMVDVSIIIYDVLGRRVAVLNDKPQPPGNYLVVWDGKDRTGLPASTGVYLCRIKTGKHIQTKKMLLLR